MSRFRAAGRRAQHVAGLDGMARVAETIFTFAAEDDEKLILDMVVVERAAGFSGRQLAVTGAKTGEAEHGAEGNVAGFEKRAFLPVLEFEACGIDDGRDVGGHVSLLVQANRTVGPGD